MAHQRAVPAGGCFWGVQDPVRRQPGVVPTRVGHTDGATANPTYRSHPGHAEAIEILFVTEVTPVSELWEAEPEHQDHLERYPGGRTCRCGRAGACPRARTPRPDPLRPEEPSP